VDELTATGQAYVIGITGTLPEPVVVAARAFVMALSQEGENVTAGCRTTAELNQVIDLLRKNKVEITSVTKQRSTLEDSFISLITKEASR
jgi:predicted glycosyltransferase